jgi:hypothetical protein
VGEFLQINQVASDYLQQYPFLLPSNVLQNRLALIGSGSKCHGLVMSTD